MMMLRPRRYPCFCHAYAASPATVSPSAGISQYISGAILFEETLYQTTSTGKSFVQLMSDQGIVAGIKVDKGLVPMVNSNNESWCMGLDGLDQRCAAYYKQGARFAKWRSVISIPAGAQRAMQLCSPLCTCCMDLHPWTALVMCCMHGSAPADGMPYAIQDSLPHSALALS